MFGMRRRPPTVQRHGKIVYSFVFGLCWGERPIRSSFREGCVAGCLKAKRFQRLRYAAPDGKPLYPLSGALVERPRLRFGPFRRVGQFHQAGLAVGTEFEDLIELWRTVD